MAGNSCKWKKKYIEKITKEKKWKSQFPGGNTVSIKNCFKSKAKWENVSTHIWTHGFNFKHGIFLLQLYLLRKRIQLKSFQSVNSWKFLQIVWLITHNFTSCSETILAFWMSKEPVVRSWHLTIYACIHSCSYCAWSFSCDLVLVGVKYSNDQRGFRTGFNGWVIHVSTNYFLNVGQYFSFFIAWIKIWCKLIPERQHILPSGALSSVINSMLGVIFIFKKIDF